MKNVKFLIIKDCMPCESLPVYGNKYWSTPNIDALAAKGTVFRRHYTAGGSTAMSLSAMFGGHYLHEFKSRKIYVNVEPNEFTSVFKRFQDLDYECHLIWDQSWQDETWNLVREFGDEEKVIVHILNTSQSVGFHNKGDLGGLTRSKMAENDSYTQIVKELEKIDLTKKQFIVMHLPHVLKGRISYMDDIDLFDRIIGYARSLVGDDSIYLTSDHGHMNMHKGIVGYGFHAYEPIARIPLITPRIADKTFCDDLTSNIDIASLLLDDCIPEHDFVYCDVAYYGQPHRVLAVIGARYKYIYNKDTRIEEFYDILWDPEENYNMCHQTYFDENRQKVGVYNELYFYPYKDEAEKYLKLYRAEKGKVWIEGEKAFELFMRTRRNVGKLYNRLNYLLK